jgi:hypothetical protein
MAVKRTQRSPSQGADGKTGKTKPPVHPDAQGKNALGGRRLGRALSEVYRGYERLNLIRDLALAQLSISDIARQVGLPRQDILDFQEAHMREIDAVRLEMAKEISVYTTEAGLWVASRSNRIAEYQQDIEDLNEDLAQIRNDDSARYGAGSTRHYQLLRAKIAALRAVADELNPRTSGQKSDDEPKNVIHYFIEGDPEIAEALT